MLMARRAGSGIPRIAGRRDGPARPAVPCWRGTDWSPDVRFPPGTGAAGRAAGMTRLVLAALAAAALAGCGVQTGGAMPSPVPGVAVAVASGPPEPFEVGHCL